MIQQAQASCTKNGAPHKMQLLAHVHVGDLITSIHKVLMWFVVGKYCLLFRFCILSWAQALPYRYSSGSHPARLHLLYRPFQLPFFSP